VGVVVKQSMREARLRLIVGWAAVVIVGALAALASAHLLGDFWAVLSRISSFAAVGTLAVAMAVIFAGVVWLVAVAWVAGSGPRGATIAAIAALITLLVIRLAISLVYDGVLSGEPKVYHGDAVDVASGRWAFWGESITRPPGYPFVLGAVYSLVGSSAAAAEALNIVFAVSTGLFVYLLARKLYGAPAGAVALLLYALWPAGALMIGVRLPHTAYDMAVVATAWAAIAAPQGWKGSAVGGVVLGLSAYLRPTALAMLPVLFVARIWARGRTQGWFTQTLLPMTVAALLMLLPIAAANLSTRGVPDISTSAFGGTTLYHGSNVDSGGTWSLAAKNELTAATDGGDAWERSAKGRELAIQRWVDDPVGMMVLAVRKQGTLWGSEAYGVRYGIRRDLASRPYLPKSVAPSLASGTFYAALLLLAAAGLYRRRRETDALGVLIVLMIMAVSVIHGLMEVRDRYHAYVIPLFMPIAAAAVVALVSRFRSRRGAQEAGPADGGEGT
jgi:4-amino-4-deoxy-L-arabinose transferase-like glycosyltransferase